jgi:hypothetical protein
VSLADDIRSRGHWWIRIRPPGFRADRLRYEELLPILKQSRVQLTGWDFPHLGHDNEVIGGRDYIGFETDWFYYREVVGLWQSGLFAYLLGIREDWYERGAPTMWRPPDTTPGRLLGLGDAVTTYAEVFEFAARLASKFEGDKHLVIAVDLHGLKGRQIYAENQARTLGSIYTAQTDRFDWTETYTRDTLLTSASELALDKSRELLLRFGIEFDITVLREIQSDTRKV